jgi:hypothetical protein
MSNAAKELAETYRQWIISPNGPLGEVLSSSNFGHLPERHYSLQNTAPRGPQTFLQWEHQTWGINLGWTDNASSVTEKKVRRWFFAKEGDQHIHYGDFVALANGNQPSFLYYHPREFGINLEWSNHPHYEWMILGGPHGTPVKTKDRVVLFNYSANIPDGDPLIHIDRNVGADIGWPELPPDFFPDHEHLFQKAAIEYLMSL